MNTERKRDLKHFYALLAELERVLGGARLLSKCDGRMGWPQRGVYFFRDPGEARSDTGAGPRIVRVGTHALIAGSSANLWSRLAWHQGQTRTGGGNHRGSIFRKLVGVALIERDGLEYPTWGKGSSAPREVRDGEIRLEQAVSKVIGAMPFLWLTVNDEPGPDSLRGYIERNAIALLSNYTDNPLDLPSEAWLGHSCNRERVRHSGLWNQRHVEESYDPTFLNTLERLIHQTGKTS